MTSLLDPSKARITMLEGRMIAWSIPSLVKVISGHMFSADPLSTRTFATIISLHLTLMYSALLGPVPSGGSSSSVKK